MTISIRIEEIGPSNNIWQNLHYGQQTKIKNRFKWLVKEAVQKQNLKPFTEDAYPVRVTLACYFGKGKIRYDWVNLSQTAKMIEDGLREEGILRQDSKKFVSYGSLIPKEDRSSRTGYSILTLTSINK